MKLKILVYILTSFFCVVTISNAQITDRPRPAEWENLVYGGRFMDRFLPMPELGKLTSNTWGAENVLPRYIDNGIESKKWSFWGGNIKLGDDGKYHFFLCGWLENSPRGHATWPNSAVFHAVSDNSYGPFVVKDTIGKGHNQEAFVLNDGKYVIYVIDGYYIANDYNGPWEYNKFEFLNRDRRIIEGLSNLTFAQREDGSYLMVCRGGGVWFSETGISSYNQVTETRAYPPIQGNFEDPVVWRDNIQYNLVVNDWRGRIAYYLRSKDGINWKTESGEAYLPGVAKHLDGNVEDWFKYERIKVLQDQYGRATQANFAVIDIAKREDKSSDNHSSKNIGIPVTVGRLLTIFDKKQISSTTKTIKVKIVAEPGFNPHEDIDINSLRFGDPEEVNYGNGGSVLKTEQSGNDLIVTFDATGNKFAEDEFAAKLLGKTCNGKLLFGYARLPGIHFIEPILSARLPEMKPNENGFDLKVEVQNFGQVVSKPVKLKIVYTKDEKEIEVSMGKIPKLKPYEKTTVNLTCEKLFEKAVKYDFVVIINPDNKSTELHGKLTPVQ
ncbi:MAG: hypothetical protein HQ541_15740 [Mariniphaga sp.]|nr:hypothetical protein [Mariniphaga sp.]